MPLYEYKCEKCGHRFEKIEPVTASEIKKCPNCRGKAVRQLASPAIQFKGSGWYVTDYAGKGAASKAGESGDGKAEPAAAADSGAPKKEVPPKEAPTKTKGKMN